MKVVRIVAVASRSGRYGGPYDTAVSQARLIGEESNYPVRLLAGHLRDDKPDMAGFGHTIRPVLVPVKNWIPLAGFPGLFSFNFLAAAIREVRNADVVHVSFARELIPVVGSIIAKILRKTLVVQPHGMLTTPKPGLKQKIFDIMVKPLYRRAHGGIALTETEAEDLQQWVGPKGSPGEMHILGNPLPFQVEGARPSSITTPPIILFAGRLHPRKRVSVFVEAAAVSSREGWAERYVIHGPDHGDGPYVQERSAQLGNLSYEGAISSHALSKVLASAHAFVLTSRNEPWGNVLVAALFAGVPVVVTRSAALANEIERNHMGLVVPDDDPAAVARSVHAIVEGKWRSEEQREAAAAYSSKRFSQSAISASLLDIYKRSHSANLGSD